jgi:outer membrane protein assembly factor BamB
VDKVWVADLENDGNMEVVAGANWLHVLDFRGKLKWEVYARRHRDTGPVWGDFVVGDVADLLGDGKLECAVVYDDSYPFMVVYDCQGRAVKQGRTHEYPPPSSWRTYVWPAGALKAADLAGGRGVRQIAIAAKGYLGFYWPNRTVPKNVAAGFRGSYIGMSILQPDPKEAAKVFTAGEMTDVHAWQDWRVNSKHPHAFAWPRQWTRTLGENISAIKAVRHKSLGRDLVWVGTERGSVFALDAKDGTVGARVPRLGAPVRRLVPDADAVLAVFADGSIKRLTPLQHRAAE